MQLRAFTIASAAADDRRLLAAGLALALHGALALAVLSFPSSRIHLPPTVTEIVLIPAPVDVEPAADVDPIVEEEPEIADPAEEDVPVEPTLELSEPTPPLEPQSVSAQSAPADSDARSSSADAYALSPGTRSVLQGLQCPGDPETFARTGLCPPGARGSSLMTAADPQASEFFAIDAAAIRARFGIAPHALAGQATLDTGQRRGALANSDSIRDALPASQPDPAFGD